MSGQRLYFVGADLKLKMVHAQELMEADEIPTVLGAEGSAINSFCIDESGFLWAVTLQGELITMSNSVSLTQGEYTTVLHATAPGLLLAQFVPGDKQKGTNRVQLYDTATNQVVHKLAYPSESTLRFSRW